MKKKFIVAIVAAIPLMMVCGGCGNKKPTMEEQNERWEYIGKVMCEDSCKAKSNIVLKKYFGTNYKLIKNEVGYDNNYNRGSFWDKGVIDGTIKGRKGQYEYHINVSVPIDSPSEWELDELRVVDAKTQHYVLVVENGIERNVKEYEKIMTSKSTSSSDIYVSDDDLSAIEDALQREWNVSNSMSAVGAESSNVFKVKKSSVSGREVTVSYSLRSTYNGQKKFVDLHGVVKKNSDGSWSVVNLGY